MSGLQEEGILPPPTETQTLTSTQKTREGRHFFLKKKRFISINVYYHPSHAHTHTHIQACILESMEAREAINSPEARVTGGGELPDVGALNLEMDMKNLTNQGTSPHSLPC